MAFSASSELYGSTAAHPAPDCVREELARILESAEFTATPRRRKMLQYLVEELLAGRGGAIKGYAIGINVLGRGEDFDPDADPAVRLEARRLRHDLDSYYVSEGRNNPLRISIPKGRYVPRVERQELIPAALHEPAGLVENPGVVPATFPTGMRWSGLVVAFAGIAIVAIAGWVAANNWVAGKADAGKSIEPPAIAMLPFEVLSTNENDRFLAIGIANRIVGELNRFPDIRIYSPRIGPEESFEPDPVAVGNQLGVTYLVAGSLRSDGPSIEVSARLIDVQTGRIVWTDTYDRTLDPGSLFVVQGEIAADIASALGQPYGVIRNELTDKLSGQFVPSMPSYECVLHAYQYRRNLSADELAGPVMDCLQKAVAENPEYPEAWALLGFLYMDAVRFSRVAAAQAQSTMDLAISAAARATALDSGNVTGLQALSAINFYQGNYAEGERFIRLALEQNPNDPETLVQAGWRMAIRGKFKEGIPLIERAIARSVSPPGWYYHLIAVDRLMKGDGVGMLDAAERSTLDNSALSQSLVAMAYGLLGNQERAHRALVRMDEISADFNPVQRIRAHQATDEIIKAATAALQSAGWQDAAEPVTPD
jgi:TolB-like protein/tetratricopeptide (TPR) repeat protein